MNKYYSIILISTLIFLTTVCVSYCVNVFFIKNASSFGKGKGGEQIRWASGAKPPVGGMSFYAVFIIAMLSIAIISYFDVIAWSTNSILLGLFLPMTMSFFVGLADDSYNTSPLIKFGGQFFCGIFFILSDNFIIICDVSWINYWFTMVWVVGMMNSINMLDNMDGVVSSVSIVSLLISLLIIVKMENIVLMDVILIVSSIGALVGFLFFNWNPARIYMGDTGSQFLGAFLAWVSIHYFWIFRDSSSSSFQAHQFLVPALAFTVSLIDTTTVTFRRLARKVSPFVGGKDHTTHHLAYLGLSDKNVVRILIGVSLLSGLVIYLIIDDLVRNNWSIYKTFAVTLFYLMIFSTIQYYYEVAKKKIYSKKVDKSLVVDNFNEVNN